MLLPYHWLIRRPIFGYEGTGVGRRVVIEGNLWDALEIFVGTKIVLPKATMEDHRGTTIFLSRVFAKTPIFEGHDYFPRQQSEITLKVRMCEVRLIACIFVFEIRVF